MRGIRSSWIAAGILVAAALLLRPPDARAYFKDSQGAERFRAALRGRLDDLAGNWSPAQRDRYARYVTDLLDSHELPLYPDDEQAFLQDFDLPAISNQSEVSDAWIALAEDSTRTMVEFFVRKRHRTPEQLREIDGQLARILEFTMSQVDRMAPRLPAVYRAYLADVFGKRLERDAASSVHGFMIRPLTEDEFAENEKWVRGWVDRSMEKIQRQGPKYAFNPDRAISGLIRAEALPEGEHRDREIASWRRQLQLSLSDAAFFARGASGIGIPRKTVLELESRQKGLAHDVWTEFERREALAWLREHPDFLRENPDLLEEFPELREEGGTEPPAAPEHAPPPPQEEAPAAAAPADATTSTSPSRPDADPPGHHPAAPQGNAWTVWARWIVPAGAILLLGVGIAVFRRARPPISRAGVGDP